MMPLTDYYFECHITIEPVFDERLELFRQIAARYDFRIAELLMKKSRDDSVKRSIYDSFCTGRSGVYDKLVADMQCLIRDLQDSKFIVYRYKIENTLLDSN